MKSGLVPRKYQALLSLIIAVITLSLATWSSHRQPSSKSSSNQGDLLVATSSSRLTTALVTEVVDGDTIRIDTGETIRYIGIDTPETKHPRKPTECYGKEASQKNIELVLGRKVRMIKDVSETDRYGRLLRYVYVGDQFINQILVKEGYAYAVAFPPDISKQELLTAAQQAAQAEERGLWDPTLCPR